jgi:cell division protein FtsW
MSHVRQALDSGIRRHRPDYSLVLIAGILLLLGVIVLYSIGPALQLSTGITVGRQLVAILLGMIAFSVTFLVPITFWAKVKTQLVWLAAMTTGLLIFAPGGVINPEAKGAKRWLVLGPLSFQPAELIKFALLIYLAALLTNRVKHGTIGKRDETLIPIAIITGVLGFIIVILQKDLGTMIAVVSIVIAMVYVAGIPMRHLAIFLAGLATVSILSIVVAPHRIERIATFVNSSSDVDGAGYHINQALIAVGSGGIFGLGLGRSVQAHGYLPEAANDSIFAIYAEKFGFIGSVVVIGILGFLLFKLAQVVEGAPNTYLRLLAAGVFAWIGSHVLINIGAILGLMPLTGITLPFLSYGGSSILFILAALGLALNVSRYSVHKRTIAMRRRRAGAGA